MPPCAVNYLEIQVLLHPSKSLHCYLDAAQLFKFQLNLEQNEATCCTAKALSKKKVGRNGKERC